jgi:hypothetical protein
MPQISVGGGPVFAANSLIASALFSDGAQILPALNCTEHEAAAVQAWLGRCTSMVVESLFRRGL